MLVVVVSVRCAAAVWGEVGSIRGVDGGELAPWLGGTGKLWLAGGNVGGRVLSRPGAGDFFGFNPHVEFRCERCCGPVDHWDVDRVTLGGDQW